MDIHTKPVTKFVISILIFLNVFSVLIIVPGYAGLRWLDNSLYNIFSFPILILPVTTIGLIVILIKKTGKNRYKMLLVFILILVQLYVLNWAIHPLVDPGRHVNTGLEAHINKIALAIESYVTKNRTLPTSNSFSSVFRNYTTYEDCFTEGDKDICNFIVSGELPPENCDATGWRGVGNNQCHFRYEAFKSSMQYNIYVKLHEPRDEYLLKYNNYKGRLEMCSIFDLNNCTYKLDTH